MMTFSQISLGKSFLSLCKLRSLNFRTFLLASSSPFEFNIMWAQSCKITLLPFFFPLINHCTSHSFFLSTTSHMVIKSTYGWFCWIHKVQERGRELEFVILPIKRQNWTDCLKVNIPYFLLFWNSSFFHIKLTNIFWCRVFNFKRLSSAWWI
jgi:hypothetical protein